MHRRERDKGNALRDFWGPTFEGAPVNKTMGKMFADRWCTKFDFAEIRPPGLHEFTVCISKLRDSAPGTDGLPLGAWKAAGEEGAKTLMAVEELMRSGLRMPMSFNESLTVFIPKGEAELDREEVLRAADEVRPISLKNSDNKVICSVLNFLLRGEVARKACTLQRGFVSGRRLLQNVVDLDAEARRIGFPSAVASIPVLVFWDLAAAFRASPTRGCGWCFAAPASRAA